MKKILFTLLFLVAFLAGYSQMSNNGGTITVESGAMLVIEGDYTSSGTGVIDIDGNVELKGDFINNNTTGGGFDVACAGTLTFNGDAAQAIGGTQQTDFYCAVVVDNLAGVSLTGADAVLYNALTLTNGKLTLNAYDLTMAAVGITVTSGNYVVTNGTGELKANVGSTDVTFPVGDASYNPVILNNTTGDADVYGVIFTEAKPGSFGADHVVDANWAISEGTLGGSLLSVTPQWLGSQELLPFTRTDCAVGVTADEGANVTWSDFGAASEPEPYTRTGTGFTTLGKFIVGDSFWNAIVLNLDLILAGAYSYDLNAMTTSLNDLDLIPTTDPYLATTIVPSIPTGVVDWVLVELRNKLDNTDVLYQIPLFVNSDGQLVNTDGVVGGKLQSIPKDDYFVSVKHRNHLGVMTNNTLDFTSGSASFDFSNPASSVYGTNPMYYDGTNTMLWAGDAYHDGTVEYNSTNSDVFPVTIAVYSDPLNVDFLENWVVSPVYDQADTDLNGTIEYNSTLSDVFPITISVYSDPGNIDFLENWVVEEQLP